MNSIPPKSSAHLYPHPIYFTSTNLSLRNLGKWFHMKHPPSHEKSWFNFYIMPTLEMVDTYKIYWTASLEEEYARGIPSGVEISELRCTCDGRILTLYTDPRARNLGIASCLLLHAKLQYERLECFLPITWSFYKEWLIQNGVICL